MSMSTGAIRGTKAEINVTPLIDVLLVLLIIFMVITPLTSKGLAALLPQPPAHEESPMGSCHAVITVQPDRTLQLNQEPVSPDNLKRRLDEVFKTRASCVVFVRGWKDLDFRDIASVIDIAHGAGLDRVALTTYW